MTQGHAQLRAETPYDAAGGDVKSRRLACPKIMAGGRRLSIAGPRERVPAAAPHPVAGEPRRSLVWRSVRRPAPLTGARREARVARPARRGLLRGPQRNACRPGLYKRVGDALP